MRAGPPRVLPRTPGAGAAHIGGMREILLDPSAALVAWLGLPLSLLVLGVALAVVLILVRHMCRALAVPAVTAEVVELPVPEEREAA